MINPKKSAFKQWRYRPLLVTALIAGNVFQLIAPALADGTLAGTDISNTATGTYADPNDPNTTINATSNTVTVKVAKVAGITVTDSGVTNYGPSGTTPITTAIKIGDVVKYDYTVTNVGNSAINFRLPNTAGVSGPGTVTGNLQYSTDGGKTFTDLPSGELITTVGIPIGGSVLVRVPVTVQTSANTGDSISVKLGGTPGNAQNVERTGTNSNGGDVYTVDTASSVGGSPVNGTRTAAATQVAKVGSVAKNLALATVLKTRTGVDTSQSTDKFNGDVLTYGLSLRVEQTDVTNTSITPAPLVGTSIKVDSTTPSTHILVSDAIPANTTFTNATAPTGWKVVYTSDPTTTLANSANWSVNKPSVVTRIGFISDTVTSVATGTTLTGFTVQVTTSGIVTTPTPPASVNIANIAQVFGQTSGDASNTLVYDDSGDQNPSNFDSTNKTFPTSPGTDSGSIDSTKPIPNQDSANNNTGTSSTTGDANVYTITPSAAISILNGPNGAPDATGPNSNNDDFTDKSALIPPNTAPGTNITPGPVAFTNTVKNTGATATTITLAPTTPTNPGDLPTGSTVTLTNGSLSATYTYTNNGTSTTAATTGSFTIATGGTPLQISNLASGATANYGVEVKLPTVPLSTDTGKGYPVPITASTAGATPATNTTIDKVYTGFLRMVKQSLVLQGSGPAVGTGQGDFTTTPTAAFDPTTSPNGATVKANEVPRTPAPGNILQYRIVYINIADKQAGSGDVILNANNIIITEDGNGIAPNTNNWAVDQDKNGVIDTSNMPGTAQDSGTANITFFSGSPATTATQDQTGTTATTDVTKYVDTVTGQVAPGQTRTFGFQRKVN